MWVPSPDSWVDDTLIVWYQIMIHLGRVKLYKKWDQSPYLDTNYFIISIQVELKTPIAEYWFAYLLFRQVVLATLEVMATP